MAFFCGDWRKGFFYQGHLSTESETEKVERKKGRKEERKKGQTTSAVEENPGSRPSLLAMSAAPPFMQ